MLDWHHHVQEKELVQRLRKLLVLVTQQHSQYLVVIHLLAPGYALLELSNHEYNHLYLLKGHQQPNEIYLHL